MPPVNKSLVYLGACVIAGLRLARERQVHARVTPTSTAIDESIDLSYEVFTRVYSQDSARSRGVGMAPSVLYWTERDRGRASYWRPRGVMHMRQVKRQGVPLTILAAERAKEVLVITFSNGHTVAYHPQFLFDVRDDDGNAELENPDERVPA